MATQLPSNANANENVTDSIAERMHRSIAKHCHNFIPHKLGLRVADRGKIVALSGSTGSAGSSILDKLLQRDDVKRVYLMTRKSKESPDIRQAGAFRERGLDTSVLLSKARRIVYLEIDFSSKRLGLTDRVYEDLRENVTHIIHSAWQVHFNYTLESYERVHIAGVRHLIDLALSSPHAQPPRFIFLSTHGAVMLYQGPSQITTVGDGAGQVLVPEAPIEDTNMSLEQGYSQGKYVSERVILKAIDAGLLATIIRVGQLSGVTTNGAWARNEYIPILIRSSLALGVVPDDLPSFRWLPADVAASAIIKQAFGISSKLAYFSTENPFPTSWNVVTRALSIASAKPMRLVPLEAWLDHVKNSKCSAREVPAIKLLDFYETHYGRWSLTSALGWENSVKIAPELAMGPITSELVHKYILNQLNQQHCTAMANAQRPHKL